MGQARRPRLLFLGRGRPRRSGPHGPDQRFLRLLRPRDADKDSFAHESSGDAERLADKPHLSRLPQRLLGKDGGSALAVVGHVDRARGFSYYWPKVGSQTENFQSALWRLFDGHPVGSAMRYLADRYAVISLRLNSELLKARRGEDVDDEVLCRLWTAQVDARSYAVLGDPAVRLNVGKE